MVLLSSLLLTPASSAEAVAEATVEVASAAEDSEEVDSGAVVLAADTTEVVAATAEGSVAEHSAEEGASLPLTS